MVERSNQEVLRHLNAFKAENFEQEWDTLLGLAAHVKFNRGGNSKHAGTIRITNLIYLHIKSPLRSLTCCATQLSAVFCFFKQKLIEFWSLLKCNYRELLNCGESFPWNTWLIVSVVSRALNHVETDVFDVARNWVERKCCTLRRATVAAEKHSRWTRSRSQRVEFLSLWSGHVFFVSLFLLFQWFVFGFLACSWTAIRTHTYIHSWFSIYFLGNSRFFWFICCLVNSQSALHGPSVKQAVSRCWWRSKWAFKSCRRSW